jgi:hypothetical protein
MEHWVQNCFHWQSLKVLRKARKLKRITTYQSCMWVLPLVFCLAYNNLEHEFHVNIFKGWASFFNFFNIIHPEVFRQL